MNERVTMFVRNDLSSDTRVWREAAALRDAGWSVKLIGVLSPETPGQERKDGIEVMRVDATPLDSRLLKPVLGGAAAEFPAAGQGSPAPVPLRRRLKRGLRAAWAPWHDELSTRAFTARALTAALAQPAAVYHAHDLNALRPAFLARRRAGGRVVFDAHEWFSERNFYRRPGPLEHARLRREERDGFRRADRCITVSESIADAVTERYGLKARPTVVMNCPDAHPGVIAAGSLRERLQAPGPVLLYIGALTFQRGLEQLIDVLALRPTWSLACLGPAQQGYWASLQARAAARGVGGRVHFLGSVPSNDVAGVAAGADLATVLIQNACLSYYYCSPNKLFEALAAGLPVVASDFPDLRRVVSGAGVGVLTDPAEPAAIAAACDAALALPREQVRNSARRLAEQYSWAHERRKLVALYDSLRTEPPQHV